VLFRVAGFSVRTPRGRIAFNGTPAFAAKTIIQVIHDSAIRTSISISATLFPELGKRKAGCHGCPEAGHIILGGEPILADDLGALGRRAVTIIAGIIAAGSKARKV
jgi:hypothetical protein